MDYAHEVGSDDDKDDDVLRSIVLLMNE